jgi:hypothetical protein
MQVNSRESDQCCEYNQSADDPRVKSRLIFDVSHDVSSTSRTHDSHRCVSVADEFGLDNRLRRLYRDREVVAKSRMTCKQSRVSDVSLLDTRNIVYRQCLNCQKISGGLTISRHPYSLSLSLHTGDSASLITAGVETDPPGYPMQGILFGGLSKQLGGSTPRQFRHCIQASSYLCDMPSHAVHAGIIVIIPDFVNVHVGHS